MSRLTLIGYWDGPSAKAPDGSACWPVVERFIDPTWDLDERETVGAYFRYGLYRIGWLGPSRCRLCGTLNGTVDLTDGVYTWPEGFAHYILEHSVRPPAEVVAHALAQSRGGEGDVDSSWWASQNGSQGTNEPRAEGSAPGRRTMQ